MPPSLWSGEIGFLEGSSLMRHIARRAGRNSATYSIHSTFHSTLPQGGRMDLALNGKTVIVTGGASNIGRAISLGFAKVVANVVIADLDLAQAQKVAHEAEALGGSCFPIKVDVTNWDSVQSMIKTAADRSGGKIDVLVNDVGYLKDVLFVEKPREDWITEIQINYVSVLNCTKALLDYMIPSKSGRIVSIGSDSARMGEYKEAVYAGC